MLSEKVQGQTGVKLAGRREWVGLGILALPCLLYSMDLTVLNLAVPALSADLKPSSAELLWIVDIYGFMIAGSLITMGTLGDKIGRRKLLLLGAAAFGFASVLAAFSGSPGQLIAARALLGIAGATLAPSTLSLISNMFPHTGERTFAIGIWTTSFSVGGAIGPLLGGIFLQHFWWGSVFLLGLPGMAVLLVLGPLLLPEFRDPESGKLDLLSALLSLLCILPFIYGLKQIAQEGITATPVLTVFAGLGVGALFIYRQKKLSHPFVDLTLFRQAAFTAALTANTLAVFAIFGMFLFTSQYFQLILGFSPLKSGVWMLPSSLGFITGSMLAPMLRRHARPGIITFISLLSASAGFMMLTQVNKFEELAMLTAGSVLFSIGTAVVITLGVDMIVGAAPPERAGAASGISETSTELGGALGIAVLGSIGTAIYKNHMSGIPLGNFSPKEVSAASGTIGAAINLASGYPAEKGLTLVTAAREAFSEAFITGAAICAVLLFGTALLALKLLKQVK